MDPNATLKELRELFAWCESTNPNLVTREDLYRAIELFDALDSWLSKGGFLPEAWKEVRNAVIEQCAAKCEEADTDHSGQSTEDFLAAKLRKMKT